MEITVKNRSLAYECFLLYEVTTKRIAALEDIRKGMASVRVKGITLLDLLRFHPNLIGRVFPQHNGSVDLLMLRLAMEFEEAHLEAEKQAKVYMEKYMDDVAKRGKLVSSSANAICKIGHIKNCLFLRLNAGFKVSTVLSLLFCIPLSNICSHYF